METNSEEFRKIAPHMANAMRRVLEEFVTYNSSITSISSEKNRGIAAVLFPSEQLSSNNRAKVEQLIAVTNAFSHRATSFENYEEIQKSAKFLMNRIKTVAKGHYDAMKTIQ